MSLLFLKADPALSSNWARSLCLKTAADVLIGNLLSDIRVLTVYAPHFISSFSIQLSKKKDHIHPDLASSAQAPYVLNHILKSHRQFINTQHFLFCTYLPSLCPLISLILHLCLLSIIFSLSITIPHIILSFLHSISSLFTLAVWGDDWLRPLARQRLHSATQLLQGGCKTWASALNVNPALF